MNPLKLTLLFCFFTTILCGQQEVPGYVVLLQGDTLEGRIVISNKWIKLRQEGAKTKYLREDLNDYGYYGNKVYFSKPDVITPAPKSNIVSDIVLESGDTLHNFHIQNLSPDYVIGYFQYPKYIVYDARKGELVQLVINDPLEGDINMYLITIDDYPKMGETLPIYVEGIVSEGLEAYNVDRRKPYRVTYRSNGVLAVLVSRSLPVGIFEPIVAKAIADSANKIEANEHSQDWLIYKNNRSYDINSIVEWKDALESIFKEDAGFFEYIKEEKIHNIKIKEVLKAYGDFITTQ